MTTCARWALRLIAAAAAATACLAASAPALAQDTARVTVPAVLSFDVTDVLTSAVASPNPTRASFDTAVIPPTQAIRFSVRADGDLIGPGGSSIPASHLSWTTSNVLNGVGVNGTLSRTSYATVFEGQPTATSGGVDLAWTLAAPGTPLRAGTYQLTLRWKAEAFVP